MATHRGQTVGMGHRNKDMEKARSAGVAEAEEEMIEDVEATGGNDEQNNVDITIGHCMDMAEGWVSYTLHIYKYYTYIYICIYLCMYICT